MKSVDGARQRCHWQLTDLGRLGFVRREAACWRCCDLTLAAMTCRSPTAASWHLHEAQSMQCAIGSAGIWKSVRCSAPVADDPFSRVRPTATEHNSSVTVAS